MVLHTRALKSHWNLQSLSTFASLSVSCVLSSLPCVNYRTIILLSASSGSSTCVGLVCTSSPLVPCRNRVAGPTLNKFESKIYWITLNVIFAAGLKSFSKPPIIKLLNFNTDAYLTRINYQRRSSSSKKTISTIEMIRRQNKYLGTALVTGMKLKCNRPCFSETESIKLLRAEWMLT